MNKSYNGTPRPQFPPGPNGNACHNECNAITAGSIQGWLNEARMCKTGNCTMTSKLGTLGSQTYPYSYDNTSQSFCLGDPGPGGNPCCPEFTKNIKPTNVTSLFSEGPHALGQPYTMTFNSSGAFSDQLETYLASWAQWLRVDGCPGVAGFKISYQLYNTGSPVKPVGPNPSGLTAMGAPHIVIYAGSSVSPATFTWNVPASPNWWFVKATVTTVGTRGEEVACKKDDGCFNNFYTGWIDDAMTAMKVAPGGIAGATASRVRFID